MALHTLVWPCLTYFGLVWPFIVFYGLLRLYMFFCGKMPIWLDLYRLRRCHRSKFIWSCLFSYLYFINFWSIFFLRKRMTLSLLSLVQFILHFDCSIIYNIIIIIDMRFALSILHRLFNQWFLFYLNVFNTSGILYQINSFWFSRSSCISEHSIL